MITAMKALARFKGLRGSRLDPFGYTAERQTERRMITDYEGVVAELLQKLSLDNLGLAVAIAELPMEIRGFGHVKDRSRAIADEKLRPLLEEFRNPTAHAHAAE